MYEARLAILASGSGSTGEAIFDHAVVVLINNPNSGIIQRVENYNERTKGERDPLKWIKLPRGKYRVINSVGVADEEKSLSDYGEALLEALVPFKVNFISQNGWLVKTPENVLREYPERIINSHPAPLDPGYPDFGGRGMHGLVTHAAVLHFYKQLGRPTNFTEVTLHRVNEDYDKGPRLVYRRVPIESEDTPETLQVRVKDMEIIQLRDFWSRYTETGVIPHAPRQNRLIGDRAQLLEEAKRIAIAQYPKG